MSIFTEQTPDIDGDEEDGKPRSSIIIPQKVMKSPLDIVNTFPSKFQSGTFKAHNPTSSDNEDDSESEDSPCYKKSSHSRSKSNGADRSKSHYGDSKELALLRQQMKRSKADTAVAKTKYELLVLRINELLAHYVIVHTEAQQLVNQDESLSEKFAIALQTANESQEDYQKFLSQKITSQQTINSPTKQGLSAHERVLEAEYLVEKTLDSFVECLQRCSEGGQDLSNRPHINEITLREKQLSAQIRELNDSKHHSLLQEDDDDGAQESGWGGKFVSSSAGALLSSKTAANNEEELQYLRITLDNQSKQLEGVLSRQADFDVQAAKIQELICIIQSSDELRDKLSEDIFSKEVLDRQLLLTKLNKQDKKLKLVNKENADFRNSLQVLHAETVRLEKRLQVEKKSSHLHSILDNKNEEERLQKLATHVEDLKEELAQLHRDNDQLQLKVQVSEQELTLIRSRPGSQVLDGMEDQFEIEETNHQDHWKIRIIQAQSSVLEEKQQIELEKQGFQERLLKVEEEREGFKRQNDNLVSENSQFKVIYKTVEKQFKDALKENDKLKKNQKDFNEKDSRLIQLEEETAAMIEQLNQFDTLKKEKEQYQNELQSLQKSYQEIEVQLSQIMAIQSNTKIASVTATADLEEEDKEEVNEESAQEKIERFSCEIEELRRQKCQVELQKVSFQSENSAFKVTYKKIEKQLRVFELDDMELFDNNDLLFEQKSIREKESLKRDLEIEKAVSTELSKNNEVTSALQVLRNELQDVKEEREELIRRVAKLESKLKQVTQENIMNKMDKEFDEPEQSSIEKVRSQVLEEKMQAEAEKVEISKQLDEQVKEKKLILVKSEAILAENQSFYQNINAIQKELKAVIKQRDALIAEKNTAKEKINDEELVKELQAANTTLSLELDAVRQRLSVAEVQKSMQSLEDEFNEESRNDQGKSLSQEDVLKEKLGALEKQKSRAEIEISNVKGTYKSMEKEFKKSVKDKDEITKKLNEAEAKIRELEEGQSSNWNINDDVVLQKIQEATEVAEEQARRKIQEIEQHAQSRIRDAEDAIQSHMRDIEVQKIQRSSIPQASSSNNDVSENNEMIDDLKLENKALMMEQNMLRKQNENLENEVQQLRDTSDEQDTQEDEIEKLQAKIVSLDKSAALLSHENNGLKSVFKSLDKELKRQVKEGDEQKKKTKNMEIQIEKAQQQLKAYRIQLGLPAEEPESNEEETQNDFPTKNHSLTKQNFSDTEYFELKERYSRLEKDFEELKSEYALQELENKEKAGVMKKTITEIELIESEKNELEKKSQSLSIESSSQKTYYNSLEKQFRKAVKELIDVKKENEKLSQYKVRLAELVERATSSSQNDSYDESDSDKLLDVDPLIELEKINQIREFEIATLIGQVEKLQEQLLQQQQSVLQLVNIQSGDKEMKDENTRLRGEDNRKSEVINSLKAKIQQLEVDTSRNLSAQLALENEIEQHKSQKQKDHLLSVQSAIKIENLELSLSSLNSQLDLQIAELTRIQTKVVEKESKVRELLIQIDSLNTNLKVQYETISALQIKQQSSSLQSLEVVELRSEVQELLLENKFAEQYKEQADIFKKKSEILETTLSELSNKKDFLAQKLKLKEEKAQADLRELRAKNIQLSEINENLKAERTTIVADLEILISQQEENEIQQISTNSTQQNISRLASPSAIASRTIQKSSSEARRKEKLMQTINNFKERIYQVDGREISLTNEEEPTIDFEANCEGNKKQLFKANKITSDSSIQQSSEDNRQQAENTYSQRLTRLEQEFQTELKAMRSVIQQKDKQIDVLKSKEHNSIQSTPRDKRQSNSQTKGITKLNNFTNNNEFNMERRKFNNLSSTASGPFYQNATASKSVQSLIVDIESKQQLIPLPIKRTPKVLTNNRSQQYNSVSDGKVIQNNASSPSGLQQWQQGSAISSKSSKEEAKLDQMYLKCIERSKTLLYKNESLLRSLKTSKDQSPSASIAAASSIISNQAQIQANQNQINNVLQQPSTLQQKVAPVSLNGSPSAMNSLADIFAQKSIQIQSPSDQYFSTKGYANQFSKSSLPKRAQTTNSSPVLNPASSTSHIASLKLDYPKVLPFVNQIVANRSNSSSSLSGLKKIGSGSALTGNLLPRYEGEKSNGQKNGTGCYYYSNGEVYQGEWKYDQREGYGILKDELGIDIYNGEWMSDVYQGQGRLRNCFTQFSLDSVSKLDHKNFDTLAHAWQFYSGEFTNNLMNGLGTLVLCNNDKFTGFFVNGKVHGEGTYYFTNGKVLEGIWQNQRLVSIKLAHKD